MTELAERRRAAPKLDEGGTDRRVDGAERREPACVHVIDDDIALRGLVVQLANSVGLASKTYASAQEFLARYDGARPGCVTLDLRLPGMTGVEALSRFAEEGVRLPVIILTGYGDVPTAVRSIQQGAVDFIQKPFNAQFLIERIQAAIAEDAARLRSDEMQSLIDERFRVLSPREKQVLSLVVDGRTSKEIARQLSISNKTVDVHRTNLMRKLEVSSFAELVRLSLAAGKTRKVS